MDVAPYVIFYTQYEEGRGGGAGSAAKIHCVIKHL